MSINVALIYGSTREGRFCDTVVNWAARELAERDDFAVDLLDPAALDLPHQHLRADSPGLIALRERIAQADAFIVVTPEYNHSFPASLKFLIDSVHGEWQAKPVAFISYGGASGGLRAIEQLRPVFAELHAVGLRDVVSFAGVWQQFDAAGMLINSARAKKSMAVLLNRLHWWATALNQARMAVPYAEAA